MTRKKSDLRAWLWYAAGDAIGRPLSDWHITDTIYQGAMIRSAEAQETHRGPMHTAEEK